MGINSENELLNAVLADSGFGFLELRKAMREFRQSTKFDKQMRHLKFVIQES